MHVDFSEKNWQGPATDFSRFDIYPWINELPNKEKVFCSLWADWWQKDLPPGYEYYLVVWHTENVDLRWLKQQVKLTKGKIIAVFDGEPYNVKIPGVEFIGYTELHNDLNKLLKWFGNQEVNNIKKYKFSTVCNRVSQGKIWTTTQLLERAAADSLIILHTDWIEDENVHNWKESGNQYLDNLTNIFKEKYINLEISDGFDNSLHRLKHTITGNPWQPIYTDCALHVVAGSFHYSFMMDDVIPYPYIHPGPDIDEKTLKCLIAGIPFLPGMQFEVYKYLEKFGLRFDYGFDTSFDLDQGNLSRFEKLCKLISELSNWSIDNLISATHDATKFNKQHIISGDFYHLCNEYNQQQIEKIYKALS